MTAWATQPAGGSVRANMLPTTAKESTVSGNYTESGRTVSPPRDRAGSVSVWQQGARGPKTGDDYILEIRVCFVYVYVMISFPRNKYLLILHHVLNYKGH